MIPVEEALANKFLPKLLELQSISGRLIKLLALGYNISGLGIPDPTEAEDESHQKSQAYNKLLVESLFKREALSCSLHSDRKS